MKRKLRHLLPIALLLCSVLNINAEVLNGSCGTNVTYSLDTSTGLLEIKGTGPMVDYSYQSAPWYSSRSSIKECDISEGVTTIGKCAFYYCFGLTSVTIPNSVTKIGNNAFYNCPGLTSINLPNSVTSIGEDAFSYCSGLTSINLPNSLTSIGYYAFSGCTSLSKVNITSLASFLNIYFSGSIANPLYSAGHLYLNGNEVTNLVIPSGTKEIKGYAFNGCVGITSVSIPNSMTTIGREAFNGCKGLKTISIPDNVTSIGESAFRNCDNLETMTINNTGDLSIMSNFVSTCKDVYVRSTTPISTYVNISGTLHLPKGYVEFFKSKGWSATKIVDDLNINMFLGSGTFGNVTWEISLDSTLVISSTSYGGAKMTSSYTTNNIVEYAKYPWYKYGNKVKHVIIKNLTSIGEKCLADMYYLEDVTTNTTKVSLAGGKYTDELFYCFGARYNKQTFEDGAYYSYYDFQVPSSLKKIIYTGNTFSLMYFSGGVSTFKTSYSNGAKYYDKTSEFHPTKPFEIHANNVTEYKLVNIPALRNTKLYLTYTGELTSRMFQNLGDLYSLSINGTGIASENGAFYTLFGIATSGNMDMMYGGGGFYIPKNLKEVHLLDGVTSIPQECFMNVTSLEKVYLPSTLRGVQDNAFYNCDGLTDIVVNAPLPPSAKDNTFDGVNLFLCKLHVPSDSKKYYSVAKGWKDFFFMEEDAEDVGKEKCAAPVVNYSNGKITCSSATPNAQCHVSYSIKDEGINTLDVNSNKIEITAYATAEGFAKSELVTKTFDYIQPVNCDINGDGKVTMADANAIVNMVLGK